MSPSKPKHTPRHLHLLLLKNLEQMVVAKANKLRKLVVVVAVAQPGATKGKL